MNHLRFIIAILWLLLAVQGASGLEVSGNGIIAKVFLPKKKFALGEPIPLQVDIINQSHAVRITDQEMYNDESFWVHLFVTCHGGGSGWAVQAVLPYPLPKPPAHRVLINGKAHPARIAKVLQHTEKIRIRMRNLCCYFPLLAELKYTVRFQTHTRLYPATYPLAPVPGQPPDEETKGKTPRLGVNQKAEYACTGICSKSHSFEIKAPPEMAKWEIKAVRQVMKKWRDTNLAMLKEPESLLDHEGERPAAYTKACINYWAGKSAALARRWSAAYILFKASESEQPGGVFESHARQEQVCVIKALVDRLKVSAGCSDSAPQEDPSKSSPHRQLVSIGEPAVACLIEALKDPKTPSASSAVVKVLKEITHQDIGPSHEEWSKWYRTRKR
jgi:hypothetical protein